VSSKHPPRGPSGVRAATRLDTVLTDRHHGDGAWHSPLLLQRLVRPPCFLRERPRWAGPGAEPGSACLVPGSRPTLSGQTEDRTLCRTPLPHPRPSGFW